MQERKIININFHYKKGKDMGNFLQFTHLISDVCMLVGILISKDLELKWEDNLHPDVPSRIALSKSNIIDIIQLGNHALKNYLIMMWKILVTTMTPCMNVSTFAWAVWYESQGFYILNSYGSLQWKHTQGVQMFYICLVRDFWTILRFVYWSQHDSITPCMNVSTFVWSMWYES